MCHGLIYINIDIYIIEHESVYLTRCSGLSLRYVRVGPVDSKDNHEAPWDSGQEILPSRPYSYDDDDDDDDDGVHYSLRL
jgi:hypothetical protein